MAEIRKQQDAHIATTRQILIDLLVLNSYVDTCQIMRMAAAGDVFHQKVIHQFVVERWRRQDFGPRYSLAQAKAILRREEEVRQNYWQRQGETHAPMIHPRPFR